MLFISKAFWILARDNGRDFVSRFFRCDYAMDLEINEVAPVCHPLVQQLSVISFHYLIAARQLVIHPTRHIAQALESQTTPFLKPTVDGYGVPTFEMLYYHV